MSTTPDIQETKALNPDVIIMDELPTPTVAALSISVAVTTISLRKPQQMVIEHIHIGMKLLFPVARGAGHAE